MEKELPKNWVEINLEDILDRMTNGVNLPQKDIAFEDSYPISRIETIAEETINFERVKYATVSKEQIQKYRLKRGDILFSHINSDKHLGKTAIYQSENILIHGINLLLFRTSKFYNPYLLNYFLKYYRYTGKFMEVAQRAVNQSSINQKKLNSFIFPLPPLSEQNRIVDKLDRLFGQLEVIKSSMEKIPVLLKNFRQQILTQAVTGKLTEEWRLEKELQEWRTDIIKNIATKMASGSTPRGGSDSYTSEGIPLVRSMNVVFGGIKLDGLAFINEDQAKVLKNVEIFFEDVLINITGASIGRVCLADKNVTGGRINQHVFIIRSKREIVLPKYLETYLSSNLIQKIIDDIKYGAGMEAISKTQIENMEINLPPIEEQQEIVSRVESLFAKADAIEEKYKNLKAKIETLPQTILHKAFKGELSEQFESDGDAKDLLEEIMALKRMK